MADFPTDTATLDNFVSPYPMGDEWGTLEDPQKMQFFTQTLGIWHALNWRVSPFVSDAVRDQLTGIFIIHLRHLVVASGTPAEAMPDFMKELLTSWTQRTGGLRGTFPIFPTAAEAGAAEDETPLTPASDRTAVRLGWEQSRIFTELAFDRPSPPIGGSVAGFDGEEIITPPFPPALSGDDTLFLGLWVSGDPTIKIENVGLTTIDYTELFPVADKQPLSVAGVAGHYYPISFRLDSEFVGEPFIVTVA